MMTEAKTGMGAAQTRGTLRIAGHHQRLRSEEEVQRVYCTIDTLISILPEW
jgi:hypothetical protein